MKVNYEHIYLIGIGGIGMSALARYFNSKPNVHVAGYDKTETDLTKALVAEGINIHYTDLGENVVSEIGDANTTLVILTPAVPAQMKELQFFVDNNYTIKKRAVVLGEISSHYKTLAVAGTHGKTTTSTMLAHVLTETSEKCNAFLGGISANFNSNLLMTDESPWLVVEADEFDRSFHQLKPFASIITSTDADHLDIYKTKEALVEAFEIFGRLNDPNGKLIVHHSVQVCADLPKLTYGINPTVKTDYKGSDLQMENGKFSMTVETPNGVFPSIVLGLPGIHNAENALSIIALCESLGLSLAEIRPALESFRGVKRRFELVAQNEDLVFIDDYAHHPTAINSLLDSIRLIYQNLPIYVVFQPHLFSRTQDFMVDFAASLSKADQVLLLPIYPAREEPIEGVTSEALSKLIEGDSNVMNPKEVVEALRDIKRGVILTVGAGDINQLVPSISALIV